MMLTHREIKKKFIDYFTSRGHAFVPSSSLIPSNDSSILFTNSGMVQFKKIFLGIDGPAHPTICNYQKCIRASGKHNDLDDVGKDSYHHTFFEMLGTWAFRGVYFKKEAVELAWGLLIKVYQLPIDRFYVTYFGGNPEMN